MLDHGLVAKAQDLRDLPVGLAARHPQHALALPCGQRRCRVRHQLVAAADAPRAFERERADQLGEGQDVVGQLRIGGGHRLVPEPAPALTARQRECVLWMARGKTDWEIARILGLSSETVVQHLKQARERYDVPKRSLLAVRVLFDGQITFGEVFRR